uniref:Integrase catalytic domain-containing protein n=1 Tax=Tanacetum cinerariifolium TaxID=118510 RepID=A0A6L2LC74_TANCI|nr:hypothetical protein [Tanacetum cinerariifolium]
MFADLEYVKSLEKEIDELESDKADFQAYMIYFSKKKLSKQTKKVSNKEYNELVKSFSKLEQHSIYIEIASQNCKEQLKNNTVGKEKASNVFLKEREQYVEIQDLKAQLQDKNIAICELKKLVKKCKGKSMETNLDKPSVIRQPNAQRIPKPSVLGKPAPFSDSFEMKSFSKTNSVPKTNVLEGVIHKTNVSISLLRSTQMKDKVMPNNSQVKDKKTEVEDHPRISSISNKIKSIVQLIIFIVDSGCTKHMTGNLKPLCNFVEKYLGFIMSKASITISSRLVNFVMRIWRGTEFSNKTLHAFCKQEGFEHQNFTPQTPEQNSIVERLNRTLVEAARTMLSAFKLPLFFWAEAITTACYTQNRSTIILTHKKKTYHIINDRKPLIKNLHIFCCTCYLTRNGENLDKMKGKGDPCILASDYDNSGLVPQLQNVSPSANTIAPSQQELDLLFSTLYDGFFNVGTSSVNKSSSPTDNSKQQDTPPKMNNPSSTEPTTPTTNVYAEENNDNQAEDTQFQQDKFINPFCILVEDGIIELYFVRTEYQLADMFTKALLEDRLYSGGGIPFQLKLDSLPHAHAQTTKTYYGHQDSRIKKAQVLKTKTSANSHIKDNSSKTKLRGRLLESLKEDAKYEHVGQDTRSQGGKDDKDKQRKDLKISQLNTNDNDKGSRSKITQNEGTSLQHNKD